MSAERYAFVSVDDKRGLVPIARELAERHRIVSLGTTAEIISDVVKVISVSEFLGDPKLTAYIDTLTDERERREASAVHLGQRMSQPRAVLAAQGREAIDLTYITLRAPQVLYGDDGLYAGVKNDKGGAFMISAAIEGGRHVFTAAQQIADFLDVSKWDGGTPSGPLALGVEASNYLDLYAEHTRKLGEMTLRSLAAA